MPLPVDPRESARYGRRKLKQDARNRRRRAQYVPTGNRVGRPRQYIGAQYVRKNGHVRLRTARTKDIAGLTLGKTWIY